VSDSFYEHHHTPKPLPEVAGSKELMYLSSFAGSDVTVDILIRKPEVNTNGPDSKAPLKQNNLIFDRLVGLQTLSVSSASGVAPIRALGIDYARGFTTGARTIAGSMIFVMPSQDVFAKYASETFKTNRDRRPETGFFIDELPEFSLIINGFNEYGQHGTSALVGVKITNFGQAFSTDDLYSEQTYTYTARYYFPMVPNPVEFINGLRSTRITATDPKLGNIFLGSERQRGTEKPESLIRTAGQDDALSQLYDSGVSVDALSRAGLTRADMLAIYKLQLDLSKVRIR
jgi:hypothetical protein